MAPEHERRGPPGPALDGDSQSFREVLIICRLRVTPATAFASLEARRGFSDRLLAFQKGMQQLWREYVLGRYLWKEISRDKAMAAVMLHYPHLSSRRKGCSST